MESLTGSLADAEAAERQLRTVSDAEILNLQNNLNAEQVACPAHMVTPAHMFYKLWTSRLLAGLCVIIQICFVGAPMQPTCLIALGCAGPVLCTKTSTQAM